MNPLALKKNIQKAIREVPKLLDQTIKDLKLEELNRKNLLKGKDSEGSDMPFYSSHSEYGYEKLRRNPLNRGRWDLKDTGQYHRGIYVKRNRSFVIFGQKYTNKKVISLERKLEVANRIALGIEQKELTRILEEKKPELKLKIENIIAGR